MGAPVVAIMGPGGQARVTLDAALAAGIEVTGLLDDSGRADYLGIPVLGAVVDWRRQHGAEFIVGMSDARQRVRLGEAMQAEGRVVRQVIHPTAWVSPFATLGVGVCVMHGAAVHPDAVLADFSILNALASVDHDCDIGRGVTLGPGVVFPGGVRVGEYAAIGAGVVARPGVVIGAKAVVGAGAAVTKDIPEGETWAGNPARSLTASPGRG
ncbi:MAG: NeuD/PglB/VioB family sugar acetyltransferase [Dehalococcoidia bacterium]